MEIIKRDFTGMQLKEYELDKKYFIDLKKVKLMSDYLGRTNCPCIHEVLGECVINNLINCKYPNCEDFDKNKIKERFKK